MKHDEQNLLSLWTAFCVFTLLTNQKFKILKNWKKAHIYYHFTYVYHKWQSHDVWFLRYEVWRIEFFVILDCFLPFYPPQKMKKATWDVIILRNCTKNDDHMVYCSCDMTLERCNCYFSFWTILCPFTLKR